MESQASMGKMLLSMPVTVSVMVHRGTCRGV